MILPDVDEKNVFAIAEILREKVWDQIMSCIGITVSIGLVVSDKNSMLDFSLLMALAGKALFKSKHTGRNKTTIACIA